MKREVIQTNVVAPPPLPSSGSAIAQVFTDETDHSFVQKRLALLYGVMGGVLFAMLIVGFVLTLAFFPEKLWELHTSWSKVAHFFAVLVMLAGAWICRGRTRPRWFLSTFDVVAMATIGLLTSLVVYFSPQGLRVEFMGCRRSSSSSRSAQRSFRARHAGRRSWRSRRRR